MNGSINQSINRTFYEKKNFFSSDPIWSEFGESCTHQNYWTNHFRRIMMRRKKRWTKFNCHFSMKKHDAEWNILVIFFLFSALPVDSQLSLLLLFFFFVPKKKKITKNPDGSYRIFNCKSHYFFSFFFGGNFYARQPHLYHNNIPEILDDHFSLHSPIFIHLSLL